MVFRKGAAVVAKKDVPPIKERLFIGTLGVNCSEYTRRTIDTVRTNCEEVNFTYIDNGSKDHVVEELKGWGKNNPDIDSFNMAFNGFNAGVAVGWNQLIKQALEWNADKILICNNDIAFGAHTIDGLVEAYNQLHHQIPETVMVTAANVTKNPNDLASIPQNWRYAEHPDFSCFMITPETIDRIGLFCEDYDPAFFEDNHTHWKILQMGYKAFKTDWAPYSHIASRTRHGNPNIVTHENFRANKIKFMRNMMCDGVGQEVAEARYAAWLADNPTVKHPTLEDVLQHAESTGAITPKLKAWLDALTIQNCPI